MITMKELGVPVRSWVPDWLGFCCIFIVILPVTMLNGSYTGSMLEVSNTLGTNSEDITMGYYAASAGMAIAYPIIPKVLAAVSVKFLLLIDLLLQFFFELDLRPFAECRYSDCLQFCYRLSERFSDVMVYSLCTEDFQCEEYPQRVLFLFLSISVRGRTGFHVGHCAIGISL